MNRDMKIIKWIESGVFDQPELPGGLPGSVGHLLDEAGEILDESCASEIIGPGVLFQAEDGKWYTASVEVVVTEANPEWVRQELADPRNKVKDVTDEDEE